MGLPIDFKRRCRDPYYVFHLVGSLCDAKIPRRPFLKSYWRAKIYEESYSALKKHISIAITTRVIINWQWIMADSHMEYYDILKKYRSSIHWMKSRVRNQCQGQQNETATSYVIIINDQVSRLKYLNKWYIYVILILCHKNWALQRTHRL